ncbi:MAG: sigma-70 family RNA polymerase sigma factor [Akkermansiaceae bacterium]|nr:sigma-70 family RNA polymerase sigma factor [Akkermansiaceae bacterium]
MPEDSENSSKVSLGTSVQSEKSITSSFSTPARTKEEFIEQALLDYESPLIAYAFTILNDLDLARDVVQDSFLRLCHQDEEKVCDNLKSWLFTVCRNRAFDILRKNKRIQPLEDAQAQSIPSSDLQPDENLSQQEQSHRLSAYLDRLTPNQREAIILKFQQGLSYQEIHEITGHSISNVGFLLHAGLKRLREMIPTDLRG